MAGSGGLRPRFEAARRSASETRTHSQIVGPDVQAIGLQDTRLAAPGSQRTSKQLSQSMSEQVNECATEPVHECATEPVNECATEPVNE